MPELIRSVVSRARMFFKDRRRSPRLRARITFSLSIFRTAKTKGAIGQHTIKGHTRDVSVKGLGLMLPQIHLDGHHLAAEGKELQLTLELAEGSVTMLVVPNRYEQLDDAELGCKYLIGAKIIQIEDSDRNRLEEFIARTLKGDPAAPQTESQLKIIQPKTFGR